MGAEFQQGADQLSRERTGLCQENWTPACKKSPPHPVTSKQIIGLKTLEEKVYSLRGLRLRQRFLRYEKRDPQDKKNDKLNLIN